MSSPFPARYELRDLLGRGGGGEVWSAQDRASQQLVAIKALHPGYSVAEADALIRETTALSGLEGFGFPRVLQLGRASDGRLFLVRELVEGRSFAEEAEADPRRALSLLCVAAEGLTVVHRAGLLHGDIKPANLIVRADGEVAFVDLGLATALREGGVRSQGLTPHYAAPELKAGAPLSVQAEVYSLGVILRDLLAEGADAEFGEKQAERLMVVEKRATAESADERYPSVDEFAQALRAALSGDVGRPSSMAIVWPVLGSEATAYALKRATDALNPGEELLVQKVAGSGSSTLFRRAAWNEALLGQSAVYVDEAAMQSGDAVDCFADLRSGSLLLLDVEPTQKLEAVDELRAQGVRLVRFARVDEEPNFVVPELEMPVLNRLLAASLGNVPTELVSYLVKRIGARPGALRRFVLEAEGLPLAGEADVDQILSGVGLQGASAQETVEACLDRGHFNSAQQHLSSLNPAEPYAAWLLARYELAAGSASAALELCEKALQAEPELSLRERLLASRARAYLGLGDYEKARGSLDGLEDFQPLAQAEAYAYRGLAYTLLAQNDLALKDLQAGMESAKQAHSARFIALVGASLATAQWRAGQGALAVDSYHAAIEAARRVGDAGMLASAQINLAGLMKERGDLAASVELLQAAVDAARKAGRINSVNQALLNLTNTDLYLGRLERARAQIMQVGEPESLPPALGAQWHGLRADLLARENEVAAALHEYEVCRKAWEALGRKSDAAEAALEACLLAAAYQPQADRSSSSFVPSITLLNSLIEHGRRLLDDSENPLLVLAEARAAEFTLSGEEAEKKAEKARNLASQSGKKEWQWRACALLADIFLEAGKRTRAARAREEAVELLEEIGARLPQDLREVYWSEPRRRVLRAQGREDAGFVPASQRAVAASELNVRGPGFVSSSGTDAISRMTMTPLERRLARVLAINSDLAGEVNVERLATKIIAHACELLAAERGYLLLGADAQSLRICASRGAQENSHQDFSRSIAQEVLSTGQPLVSIDTGRDQRIQAFESVHLAAVSAVACVPILSPRGLPIGAIYVETRTGARPSFGDEVPTLQAFADQAAIALENARLLTELQQKSEDLEERNQHLKEARLRLKGLLGKRTARLREVRSELKNTKDQLASHASYGAMVGQSESMRKIYALIERIKDTDVPVLITGESGTGKEIAARAIYEGSARASGKMLAVNCGAVPESILESELFGHSRGAFTGADRDRKGLFREAHRGVLFLDEIGETPLKMQTSLLRVLQEGRVRPVGGAEELPADVRVIFATNRDLKEAVRQGKFREDLLYRIQVVEIALPALRERREDIPLLCDHFMQRFSLRFGQNKKTISREAMDALLDYPFPGNIRQLENVLLSAWVLCEEEVIDLHDLRLQPIKQENSPSSSRPSLASSVPHAPAAPAKTGRVPGAPPSARAAFKASSGKRGTLSEHERGERQRIVEALEETGWNRVKAAELLQMPRRTLYRRLKEFNIQ